MKKQNKKTFAQRAKDIQKKYTRAKFDPIEAADMEAELESLMQEQEAIRESMGMNQQQQQFATGGMIMATGGPPGETPHADLIDKYFSDERGFSEADREIARYIMMRESGGNPKAQGINNNPEVTKNKKYFGSKDSGLFQINSVAHPKAYEEGDIFDPEYNVKYASEVAMRSRNAGKDPFAPWSSFQSSKDKVAEIRSKYTPENTDVDNVSSAPTRQSLIDAQPDWKKTQPMSYNDATAGAWNTERGKYNLIGKAGDAIGNWASKAYQNIVPENIREGIGNVAETLDLINHGFIKPEDRTPLIGGNPPIGVGIKGGAGNLLKGVPTKVGKGTTLFPTTAEGMTGLTQGAGNLPATIGRGVTGIVPESSQYVPYFGSRVAGAIGQGQPALGQGVKALGQGMRNALPQGSQFPATITKGVSNRLLPDVNQYIPFIPRAGTRALGAAGVEGAEALGAGATRQALGQGMPGGKLTKWQPQPKVGGRTVRPIKYPLVSPTYLPQERQGTGPIGGQDSPRVDMEPIPSIKNRFNTQRPELGLWDRTKPRADVDSTPMKNITPTLSRATDYQQGLTVDEKPVYGGVKGESWWDKNKQYMPYAISGLSNIGSNLLMAGLAGKNNPRVSSPMIKPEEINPQAQIDQLKKDSGVTKNVNMYNARNLGLNSGATMANVGAANTDVDRNFGRTATGLQLGADQFNAQAKNRAGIYNAQNKTRADMFNAQMDLKAKDDKLGYLSGALGTIPGVMKDIRMDKADKEMRQVLDNAYKNSGGRNYMPVGTSIFDDKFGEYVVKGHDPSTGEPILEKAKNKKEKNR